MMRGLLRIVGTVLAFIALAVVTLNVEAVATAVGLDNVAAHPDLIGTIAAVLTAPLTLYVALICLGFGLFLLLDRLARRWDGNHPSEDQRLRAMWLDLDNLSDLIEDELQRGQAVPSVALASKVAAKFTTLNRLGLHTPVLAPAGRYWFSTLKMFIDHIAPVLREGHIQDAKALADEFIQELGKVTPEGRAKVQEQLDQHFGSTF
jgi:hypothetical protein